MIIMCQCCALTVNAWQGRTKFKCSYPFTCASDVKNWGSLTKSDSWIIYICTFQECVIQIKYTIFNLIIRLSHFD